MPGLDHTGPMGQGPRTGRNKGKCTQEKNSNKENKGFFGLGWRRGESSGRGRRGKGTGRGFGWNRRTD